MKICKTCGTEKGEEEFHKKGKARHASCRSCRKPLKADYYKKNRDRTLVRVKEYVSKNKEKVRKNWENWFSKNKDRFKKKRLEYVQKNKSKLNASSKEWNRKKIASDPMYKMRVRIRNTVCPYKKYKTKRTFEILGCTPEQLRSHIQDHFKPGMHWNNHGAGKGRWQYDHHIPLSSAKTEAELLTICHYTNLRPLWAEENVKKGAKMPEDFYGII